MSPRTANETGNFRTFIRRGCARTMFPMRRSPAGRLLRRSREDPRAVSPINTHNTRDKYKRRLLKGTSPGGGRRARGETRNTGFALLETQSGRSGPGPAYKFPRPIGGGGRRAGSGANPRPSSTTARETRVHGGKCVGAAATFSRGTKRAGANCFRPHGFSSGESKPSAGNPRRGGFLISALVGAR